MANYGIKISKAGYDVKTADVKDQIFNSSANSFKIAQEGDASVTVPEYIGYPVFGPVDETITIAHSLGYIPGFLVFCEFDEDGRWYLSYSFDLFSGYNQGVWAKADSSNLYVTFDTHRDSSYVGTVRYYLFVDPGA